MRSSARPSKAQLRQRQQDDKWYATCLGTGGRNPVAPPLITEGERTVAERNGFTLVETLIVIVIVSLLTLIALPKFQAGVNRSNLLAARAKVISSFAAARATAAGSGRRTTLHLGGSTVMVTATPRLTGAGTRDTIVRPYNLSTRYGVTTANTVDSVLIDPNGLPRNGSNVALGHGSLKDTIQINVYGRVLK
jgi:prepilin-type N-terminal cleavage/methylation domain-containing protein